MSWKIRYREIFRGLDGVQLTIFAFAILLTGLMWVGLHLQISNDRDRATNKQQAENENMVSLFEKHVERTLATASFTLKQMEVEYTAMRDRLDLEKYYERHREELEPYSVISVIDMQGIVRHASYTNFKPLDVRNVENYKIHRQDPSQRIFVSKPRIGAASGNYTIYLSRRINRPDGSFGGYAVVGLAPEYFSRFYNEINLGANSVVMLLGMDGIVRARSSNAASPEEYVGADLNNTKFFKEFLKQKESGSYRDVRPIDNVFRQYSFKVVNGYPLVVLVGTSEAAVLAEIEQRKTLYISIASIVTILIGSFTSIILLRLEREARAVDALRLSEQRYAHAQRATNDGLWDRDLLSGKTYLSSRAREILGHPLNSTFFGVDLLNLHPDDIPVVRQFLRWPQESNAPYHVECRLRQSDGGCRNILLRGEIVCDARGLPDRMIGSIADITGQRTAENKLQKQAELLDQIFRYTLDSIVILDRNYNFVRVSESYARAGQRESSSFLGRNHFEIYPSEFEQEIEPFRLQKKVYSRSARPFIFPDHPEFGVTYWNISLVPLLDSDGEIEFFLMNLKDVTSETRADKINQVYIKQLRALSRRIVAVQELERRSLARELHDEIGQELTAVKIHLQTLEHTLQSDNNEYFADRFDDVLSTITKILSQVRDISLNLRPMYLDDLGLNVALVSLVKRLSDVAGWTIHLDIDIQSLPPDPDRDLACYRVAQEALTNIMRHAEASEVWVSLRYNNEWLELVVRDNGQGFERESIHEKTMTHFGLFGMEERVSNLGGQFEVNSSDREGTELRAHFPLSIILETHA